MAIRLYNIKQRALNSEKLSEILDFSSNDFCGMITSLDIPFTYNTAQSTWSWKSDLNSLIKLISGGIYIELDDTESHSLTSNNQLWGIDIQLGLDGNILTEEYSSATLTSISCNILQATETFYPVINPFGNPHAKGYYEYTASGWVITSDTTISSSKIYYYIVEKQAFEIRNASFSGGITKSFTYNGQTLWVNDKRMFIPLCGLDNSGEFVSVVFNRNKYGHESFLSARTYYTLVEEFSDKFVWRVGGTSKGDIGNLNITNNTISSLNNTDKVEIEHAYLKDVIVPGSLEPSANIDNLLIIANDGEVFKTDSDYIMPIRHGGTGANARDTAKQNLGIFYGVNDPNQVAPTSSPIQGDLYFKIIE